MNKINKLKGKAFHFNCRSLMSNRWKFQMIDTKDIKALKDVSLNGIINKIIPSLITQNCTVLQN